MVFFFEAKSDCDHASISDGTPNLGGVSVGVWCLSLCDWDNVSHSLNELAAQGGVARPQVVLGVIGLGYGFEGT